MDVFAHLCGQKADTSSNYCDNIQPYDKRRFFLFVKCDTTFRLFFLEITTISYFKVSQGSVETHRSYDGKYYISFVGNLLSFPAVKEFRKSVKN